MIGPIPETLPNGERPHPTMVGRTIGARKCKNGHDRMLVGMWGKGCAECHRQVMRLRKERGHAPKLTCEYCRNGHHKPTVGMTKNNGCKECARVNGREYRRRERAAKYDVPMELLGADKRQPFGKKLRGLRESLGMTRSDLERASGVSRFTIIDIERERSRGWPTTKKKLLDAFSRLIRENHRGRYTRLMLGLVEAERRGNPTSVEAARIAGIEGNHVWYLLRWLGQRGLAERFENEKGVFWMATDEGRVLIGGAAA